MRLNVRYRFEPPDLAVNDWGIRETLSFGGKPFACAVPWSAVFAISNQAKVWIFPGDVPEELMEQFARAAAAAEAETRSELRVVAPIDSPSAPDAPNENKPAVATPKLRLVKNE